MPHTINVRLTSIQRSALQHLTTPALFNSHSRSRSLSIHPLTSSFTENKQVSLQDGADASKLEAAKKTVTDQGGKITKEFKLVKGFTYVLPSPITHEKVL
jgi:hypothetical protein